MPSSECRRSQSRIHLSVPCSRDFVRVEADREASMRRQEQQQQHEQRMKRQESEKLLGIGLAGYLQRLSDLIGPGVPI